MSCTNPRYSILQSAPPPFFLKTHFRVATFIHLISLLFIGCIFLFLDIFSLLLSMCLFGQDGRVVTWTPGEVLFINKQKSPPVQLLSYPLLRINKKTFWRREQDI